MTTTPQLTSRSRTRAGLASVLCLSALLVPAAGSASGFAVARFGGEHGTPVDVNPTAIYYNPAAMAFGDGTHVMLDVNLAVRNATYERPASGISMQPPSDIEIAANSGKATLDNLLYSPFVGVTSDLGLDAPVTFGIGFFAPFGGQAVWDDAPPIEGAPGAEDGVQRWYNIEGTIRTLAFSAGGAYRIESARLAFGLTGNLYITEIDSLRARNADGSDTLTAGDSLQEGRAWIRADGMQWGIGAGVMWEAVEQELWIGASYQTRPNLDGEMALEGTMEDLLGSGQPSHDLITITHQLPDIFRLGARYRPTPELELKLFGDFTRWSVFEQQCITNNEWPGDIETVCEVDESGAQTATENTAKVIQNLIRRWDDAFGVRLGASYFFTPEWEGILGAGYDASAVPDEALEASLPDWDKASASLGARYQIMPELALMLTASNIFYFERDTSDVATSERFLERSHLPSSAGIYNQNVFLVNTNLELSFGQ